MRLMFLLVAVGLMALVACGEVASPPVSNAPDLEATVEARVQATIEAPVPTAMPDLGATVTARVESTRAAQQTVTSTSVPTQTPIPSATPAPAPTRTPRPTATPDASSYYRLGRDSLEKGEYNEAISNFTAAIQLYPEHATAYLLRGAVYADNDDHDMAIADLEKGLELDPGNSNAKEVLAKIYGRRGAAYILEEDYASATDDFDRAIELNPNDSDIKFAGAGAYALRGLVYAMEGDYHSAIADLDRAIELNPNNSDFQDLRASMSTLSSSLAPSPTSAPEGYSRNKPMPLNRAMPIQGNVSLRVVDVITNATPEVLNHSWLNDAPPTGFQYLIIVIEVHNDSDSVVDPFFLTDLGLIGKTNVAYSQFDLDNMCGLEIPNSINYLTSIFPGGKLTGNICFSVQSSEVDSLVMYHRDPWGLNENILYWALR